MLGFGGGALKKAGTVSALMKLIINLSEKTTNEKFISLVNMIRCASQTVYGKKGLFIFPTYLPMYLLSVYSIFDFQSVMNRCILVQVTNVICHPSWTTSRLICTLFKIDEPVDSFLGSFDNAKLLHRH